MKPDDPRDSQQSAADRTAARRMNIPKASPQAKKLRRERNSASRKREGSRKRRDYYKAQPPTPEQIQRTEAVRAARDAANLAANIANMERRLASAELQYAAAEQGFAGRKTSDGERQWLDELWAVVELRRSELEDYRRSMVAVAASAEHRGVRSFRPVPSRGNSSDI